MVKTLLFIFFLSTSTLLFAQNVERVKINGVIKAPKGEDVEGVTIYNKTSQKGTTSIADGSFSIEVSENDRLLIAAIQFQSFTVIVDKGVVTSKNLSIYLNPALNTLDEVIVRPYDLSGNVQADVGKIKTYNVPVAWDLSYETLEFRSNFTDDAFSKIRRNAAEEALHNNTIQNGANLSAIYNLISNALFPNRQKSNLEQTIEGNQLVANLKQRFTKPYVIATFNVEEEQASDFLYFAEERGIPQNLLKSENEMELLKLLLQRSEEYKALGEKQ